MTTLTCSRCKRAADPDLDCLVVVLGVPLCSECSAKKADEIDQAKVDRVDRAEQELADRIEGEVHAR